MTVIKRLHRLAPLALAIACSAAAPAYAAVTEQEAKRSFEPYADGFPSFPGLKPGMVINKSNVAQFKDVMDEGLIKIVENGWDEIHVGETTNFTVDPHYVAATLANLNKAALGEKNGEITGFAAGRAFPGEPSLDDPRAGEKIAWNYKYGINWGDNAAIYPFYWKYRNMNSGNVERTIKFNFHFLNFKHRVQHEPLPEVLPNPSNFFRAIYAQVLEPQDLKGTQLLIQRYDDDLKLDDAYLYLGFQRRVRRLATGQTTDAFLGSDLMIEDFEGYNGRVSDQKWTYKGTRNILMPYYNHNDMALTDEYKDPEYKFVDFGGQGGCFPKITWQLRKVYVLEAAPVDPGHPISKRVLHIDAQVNNINRTLIYDRKGELWKNWTIGKSHPDHHLPINKGTGIAIDDSFSMVDMQSMHCTTGQFKGQVDPKLSPARRFQVQSLRGSD
jgi:hypothetical protein